MIKRIVQEERICDLCQKVCTTDNKKIVISIGGNRINLRASVFIDYGTNDGDICSECLKEHLKKYFNERK